MPRYEKFSLTFKQCLHRSMPPWTRFIVVECALESYFILVLRFPVQKSRRRVVSTEKFSVPHGVSLANHLADNGMRCASIPTVSHALFLPIERLVSLLNENKHRLIVYFHE